MCFRYLKSLVQNLMLIQRFKKLTIEHSPRQERLNFWLDIIFEATKETTNGLRFPVSLCNVQSLYIWLIWTKILYTLA